jgi:hypothetical protein
MGVDAAIYTDSDYSWVCKVGERRSPAEVARGTAQRLAGGEAVVEMSHEAGSSLGAARGGSRRITR